MLCSFFRVNESVLVEVQRDIGAGFCCCLRLVCWFSTVYVSGCRWLARGCNLALSGVVTAKRLTLMLAGFNAIGRGPAR
jgi:hypothetical protein